MIALNIVLMAATVTRWYMLAARMVDLAAPDSTPATRQPGEAQPAGTFQRSITRDSCS